MIDMTGRVKVPRASVLVKCFESVHGGRGKEFSSLGHRSGSRSFISFVVCDQPRPFTLEVQRTPYLLRAVQNLFLSSQAQCLRQIVVSVSSLVRHRPVGPVYQKAHLSFRDIRSETQP